MKNLNNLSKKQLIQIIKNLSSKETVKIIEVIDKIKKPQIIKHKCNCCPNLDDHYHYIDGHEMGQN